MALATRDQVAHRIGPTKITDAGITDPAGINLAIADAELEVKSIINSMVDFTKVPPMPKTQAAINQAVLYKACEIILVQIHSASRSVDTISDVEYWRRKCKDICDQINKGLANLTNADGSTALSSQGTFENTDINKPMSGNTRWGDFVDPLDPNGTQVENQTTPFF